MPPRAVIIDETFSLEKTPDLTLVEREVVRFFLQLSQMLGLPPSVAQIYGLLFCNATPLAFDTIQARLGISKGSTSQGLNFLRRLEMVQIVRIPKDRRHHFVAETSLARFIKVMLQERVLPVLETTERQLAELEQTLAGEPELGAGQECRLQRLRGWNRRAKEMLPLVLNLAEGG